MPKRRRQAQKAKPKAGTNLSIRLGDLREDVEAVARKNNLSVADVTRLCVQRALPVIARHLDAMTKEIGTAPGGKAP
jgi:hypothetical protein